MNSPTRAITRNRIAKLREAKGWSQEATAKFLGITKSGVSRHETGDRNLTSDMVKRYAELFSVEPIDIFMETDAEGGLETPSEQ